MTVSISGIQAAQQRLSPSAVYTPLLENDLVNRRLGARLLLKAECLQRGGSFKFRGAYNRLSQLEDNEIGAGVVAFSSGNHAQGVALAANILGIQATIVMPSDAPAIKRERTEAYGATVKPYDRHNESREDIAAGLADSTGAVLVPSYDDPYIITGQGTCGLEITQQCQLLGLQPDLVLSPCGGGGLIAGSSIAIKESYPQTEIYCVEPEDFDDHRRSLISGRREKIVEGGTSICDALLAPTPGKLTWKINQDNLSGGLAVSDDEVSHAISLAHQFFKLVLEPGGAVALAAVLSGKIHVSEKNIVVIVSGGNVDPACFSNCLAAYPSP